MRMTTRLARGNRTLFTGRRWGVILPPWIWLAIFFVLPFLIVFKISLSEARLAIPPFTDLLCWIDPNTGQCALPGGVRGNRLSLSINLGNFWNLTQDSLYFKAYLNSLRIAFFSTLFCLLIGYPMAYAIAKMKPSGRNVALMLVILPSWTSYLIRVYAWIGILKSNGYLNNLLMDIGVIDAPLGILYTEAAMYIGIVYTYLPFMVLPLYANLSKMDFRLLEAASDLGAGPFRAFLTITLPLSLSGIIAGSMLVFIPAVGEFVVPELLGGPDGVMIGKVLWSEFFSNRDWPMASAVAVVMLLILMIPILYYQKVQTQEMEQRR